MRRLFNSRKGLSPVLSTVLMILVVIIGMSLLFAFFVNYARDFQTGSGSAVLESMVIEDVWFRDSTTEVWVYNVGKVDSRITTFYVDGRQVWPSDWYVDVPVGGHEKLPVPYDFESGTSYSFKIVTARGTALEGVYIC